MRLLGGFELVALLDILVQTDRTLGAAGATPALTYRTGPLHVGAEGAPLRCCSVVDGGDGTESRLRSGVRRFWRKEEHASGGFEVRQHIGVQNGEHSQRGWHRCGVA